MIVAELERGLLARYPKADAEGWDHVGSPWRSAAEITGCLRSMRPKLMFAAPRRRRQRAADASSHISRRPRRLSGVPHAPNAARRSTRQRVAREHYLAPHQPGPLARSPRRLSELLGADP
ncbi:MAG: hypothetical protein ACLTYW_02475 [Collinsella sp.]